MENGVYHARWYAVVTYRSAAGPVAIEHFLIELHEIDDLIERGPHWDTIEKIEIHRYNHFISPDLTLEQAAVL